MTQHYVAVRFDAVRPGSPVAQVTLNAGVSEWLYYRLPQGTTVKVRYATEDPRIALLEGERGFDL
jgi:hypothetical protein